MPFMDANGVSIHYELAGRGSSAVLLHEMGGTLASWDGIAPVLSRRFRTLRYDQRGGIVVATARQRLRAVGRAEPHAGLRQRGERDLDAEAVHQLERELRGPVGIAADRGAAAGLVHRLAVERRNVVEMNVDPAG